MPIVAVRNVYKRYTGALGAVHALRGVSLVLDRGAVCALVGPSGSGKTTLLSILGGLDVPTAGMVEIDGRALHGMTPGERSRFRAARVGFVFQTHNLIPVLTAAENVALPLVLRRMSAKERARKVDAVLDELGIRGVARHRPGELSGGQQQRVGIARALVTDPAIVLADEPTAHLDSATGADVMRALGAVQRRRDTTLVFSTHDPAIEAVADVRVVLRDGRAARRALGEENGTCHHSFGSPSATSSVIAVAP